MQAAAREAEREARHTAEAERIRREAAAAAAEKQRVSVSCRACRMPRTTVMTTLLHAADHDMDDVHLALRHICNLHLSRKPEGVVITLHIGRARLASLAPSISVSLTLALTPVAAFSSTCVTSHPEPVCDPNPEATPLPRAAGGGAEAGGRGQGRGSRLLGPHGADRAPELPPALALRRRRFERQLRLGLRARRSAAVGADAALLRPQQVCCLDAAVMRLATAR